MEQSQVLSITKLFESPLNPRRHYNEKKMEELVESVRTKGILMPLLVRPNDGRFEIAAGHRRYRAAIKVKLQEVPVIVREMTDTDFLEILTIENLQREDLEPLDEAQGYRTLMEKASYDVPSIAVKVGKSESYIYQRLKLLELIPEAQKQLAEEKITAGHAILIARLQPNEQKECLEAIKEEGGMSVRDLADHIESQIHLDLNSASFSKKDPELVPEAGPCTTCPKRTGFVPQLFPDIKKKDTCTDPDCFHGKVAAFTAKWLKEKSEDTDRPPLRLSREYNYRATKIPEGQEKPIPSNLWTEIADRKKGSCDSAREGIVVEGHDQGQVMTVCADPKCKKHHHQYEPSPGMDKWQVQQKVAQEKKKQEKAIRARILDETMKKVPAKLTRADLILVVSQFYDEIWQEHQRELLQRHSIKPLKLQYGIDTDKPIKGLIDDCRDVDLIRLLVEMALIRNVEGPNSGRKKGDPLLETAARYKINVKAIEAELKQTLKEKAKKGKMASPAKKSGKKKNIHDLTATAPGKEIPCLDCANDATNGDGDCFREDFHTDNKGNLLCESKKPLHTSAKSKKKKGLKK